MLNVTCKVCGAKESFKDIPVRCRSCGHRFINTTSKKRGQDPDWRTAWESKNQWERKLLGLQDEEEKEP